MNILLSTPRTQPPGINYLSTISLGLQDRGHRIDAIQFAVVPKADFPDDVETRWVSRSVDKYIDQNIAGENYRWITTFGRLGYNRLLYSRWRRIVRSKLQAGDYDAVISDRICSAPGTLAGMDTDTPSIIVTTGPAALKYHSGTDLDKTPRFFEVPWHVRMQYPFVKSLHRWNRKAFVGASEVVAINKFDASITAKTFGREPRIVYLPVDLDGFKIEQPDPSKITLINPRDRHKGLDTFLKIADRLPDQEFQIAGTLYDKSLTSEVEDRDNITHLGWCDDMREVYATTKILTIPSTYQEGGNRIIAEAFVNGIPVIGSDLGGIPDYVGDGGIVVKDYTDVDAWTVAVQDLIDDPESYDTYSRQARQRAELFELEGRVDEFESILQSISS